MLRILSLSSLPLLLQVLGKNILKVLNCTNLVLRLSIIKSLILIGSLLFCAPFGLNYILWGLVISQVLATSVWIVAVDRKIGSSKYVKLTLLYLFMGLMFLTLVTIL